MFGRLIDVYNTILQVIKLWRAELRLFMVFCSIRPTVPTYEENSLSAKTRFIMLLSAFFTALQTSGTANTLPFLYNKPTGEKVWAHGHGVLCEQADLIRFEGGWKTKATK